MCRSVIFSLDKEEEGEDGSSNTNSVSRLLPLTHFATGQTPI